GGGGPRWPGRFQFIAGIGGHRDVVLDVAHNPAGAWALRSALSENFEDRALTIVFGAMRDKALGEMAEILFPTASHVVLTHADSPRAAQPDEIRAASRVAEAAEMAATGKDAMPRAFTLSPKGGLVVVTGSIYVVGEALKALES